jgi:5-methylcytosine-specific restriction protein A
LPTNSAAWRALRAQVLFDEPLCRECQRQGVVTPASVVDHVDGDSHNNERSNLAPTCASCHSLLTAKHDGGFGNARRAR